MFKRFGLYHLIALIAISMASINASAQTWEEISKSYDKNFQDYKAKNEAMFNKFVEENDKAFADLLRKGWSEFLLVQGIEPPVNPKPNDIPTIDPMKVKKDKPIVVVLEEEDEEVIINKKKKKVKPKAPGLQKNEPDDFDKKNFELEFYGQKLPFSYDASFQTSVHTIDQNAIADYWDAMVATNHYHFVNQLFDYRTLLNLNDWGFFLLTQKAAKQVTDSDNAANLLTWFMMMKSQYKVKIGFSNSSVHVLLPSQDMMYGKPYYTFNNEKYFVLDKNAGKIRTYESNYADAHYLIDFAMTSPMNLGNEEGVRTMSFKHKGKSHTFDVKYNKSNIDFFNDYPHVNVKIYFDAAVSATGKESLVKNIKPLVEGMDELDAVNLLLRLVQTGFDYKTDQQQFNREKFFFAEELLYYPYSDCEDRSVLFSYLVRQILGLKAVGLAFPGHMATAVRFTEDYGFDRVEYKGDNYVICDPTYINANAGMCMPQFINVKAKPIELEGDHTEKLVAQELWSTLSDGGLFKGAQTNNSVTDNNENTYLTGYFVKSGNINGFEVKSISKKNSIFVAKFNKNKELQWVTPITGRASGEGHHVTIDANKNVYVTGFFEGTLDFNGTQLLSKGKEAFLARLDQSGKITWGGVVGLNEIQSTTDYIFVTRFSPDGKFLSKFVFDETENFNNYGVSFYVNGDVRVTGTMLASGLAAAETGNFNSYAYATSAGNLPGVWKAEMDKLVAQDYDKAMAGLFAFLKTIKLNGSSVDGKTIRDAIDKNNPSFRKTAPTLHKALGEIAFVKNNGGNVSITSKTGQNLQVTRDISLKNNAKMKVTTFSAGNAQIDFLSGANLGQSITGFQINLIKLLKNNGNVVLDYDVNHTQKSMNLKKDFLK